MGWNWHCVDLIIMYKNILKFRAWSFFGKKFYHKVLCGNTETNDPPSYVYSDDHMKWIVFDDTDGIIQQYTGYMDSNGNDIYVGDLLKYNATVVDKDNCFVLPTNEIVSDVIWKYDRYWLNDGNFSNTLENIKYKEIIGHIFEPLENLE